MSPRERQNSPQNAAKGAPKVRTREKPSQSSQRACESRTAHLELTLPVPPSTNNAYSNNPKTRGRSLTPRGRAYKADVMHLANEAGAQKVRLEPPLELVIELYFPDYRRRDADNFVKLLQDSLLEAVGHDDRGVDVLWVSKSLDRENPRAFVRLSSHDVVREESA